MDQSLIEPDRIRVREHEKGKEQQRRECIRMDASVTGINLLQLVVAVLALTLLWYNFKSFRDIHEGREISDKTAYTLEISNMIAFVLTLLPFAIAFLVLVIGLVWVTTSS